MSTATEPIAAGTREGDADWAVAFCESIRLNGGPRGDFNRRTIPPILARLAHLSRHAAKVQESLSWCNPVVEGGEVSISREYWNDLKRDLDAMLGGPADA